MLLTAEPPLTSSLRVRLKVATAAAHERLDAKAAALPLSSRANYTRFLEAHASAFIPLEQSLVAGDVARLVPDWAERQRSGALMRDLDLLRGDLRALVVPEFAHEAEMFGVLYVLEGSRLGARFILKDLDENVTGRATHYLKHGQTEKLWPTFLSQLEASQAAQEDYATAIEAALTTFEIFERAFSAFEQVAA